MILTKLTFPNRLQTSTVIMLLHPNRMREIFIGKIQAGLMIDTITGIVIEETVEMDMDMIEWTGVDGVEGIGERTGMIAGMIEILETIVMKVGIVIMIIHITVVIVMETGGMTEIETSTTTKWIAIMIIEITECMIEYLTIETVLIMI